MASLPCKGRAGEGLTRRSIMNRRGPPPCLPLAGGGGRWRRPLPPLQGEGWGGVSAAFDPETSRPPPCLPLAGGGGRWRRPLPPLQGEGWGGVNATFDPETSLTPTLPPPCRGRIARRADLFVTCACHSRPERSGGEGNPASFAQGPGSPSRRFAPPGMTVHTAFSQACAGSSVKRQARFGPAITLR